MSTKPTSRPRIELSIPDDPKLRTIAVITKDGDAVIVFKKATAEQLTEEGVPVLMHLAMHLTKKEKDNQ
mgnify:CR=1 FL=1